MIISDAKRLAYHANLLFICAAPAMAQTNETIIQKFKGSPLGGASPVSSLIESSKGVLYGTSSGDPGKRNVHGGTVFSLTFKSNRWKLDTLYEFQGGNDGSNPLAALVGDPKKALYGTTSNGGSIPGQKGSAQNGIVFMLTPPAAGSKIWNETVLYRFAEGALATPKGPLIIGSNGVLYGTAAYGGTQGSGGVFALAPPSKKGGTWTQTTIYSFQGGDDGATPVAGLYIDATGKLYGTTLQGGGGYNSEMCNGSVNNYTGCGTVFQLAPPSEGQTNWTETIIYAFTGAGSDGLLPYSTLVSDASGSLYGTTGYGGPQFGAYSGNVFRLSPPTGGDTQWTESSLFEFSGENGALPLCGVVFGPNGYLYGTAQWGGDYQNGVAFSLAPPTGGGTSWTETVLHSFGQGTDGFYPVASPLVSNSTTLFGTTWKGDGYGTVYELTP